MMRPEAVYQYPIWTVALSLVVAAVIATMLLEIGVRRFVSADFRRQHNEIAAAIFSIIGVTYAVLLAFPASFFPFTIGRKSAAAQRCAEGAVLDRDPRSRGTIGRAARLPGVGYYVQHHFSQDHWANRWPLPDGIDCMDIVLDGAAEIGFANIDGLYRYAEASPVLFGDVFHLFEHIVAYNLPRGSHTLVDREADGIPNGPDRLYRLHLHLNGGSGDGFRPWLSEWARHLAAAPAVRKLRLHLPEPYDNAHPSPPSPHGDHQVSDERKDIGVIEIGFASALTAREFWESEAYLTTVEDQRRYLRSVGAFLVTGVYTYVRDGVITTAGLRGSRTAELIERIGAVNQTRDEVTRRFVQPPR